MYSNFLLKLITTTVLTVAIQCCAANNAAEQGQVEENLGVTTLALQTGEVVELAIDFSIASIKIAPDGLSKMILKATVEKKEVGFVAQMSPKDMRADGIKSYDELPGLGAKITITNLGETTKTLEQFVYQHLLVRKKSNSMRFQGTYSIVYCSPSVNFSTPFIFYARSDGIFFDDNGVQAQEDPINNFYDLVFLMDGPRKRLTVYFSESAGYGGRSPADIARMQWLKGTSGPAKVDMSQQKGSCCGN